MAEPDSVGVAQDMGFDEMAVDFGAVGGSEVGEGVNSRAINQLRVGTGDGWIIDPNLGVRCATD